MTQPSNSFQNQQGGGPPPTKKPRQNLPNKNGDNAGASSSGASPIIPQTKREPKPEIHEEIEVLDDDDPSQLEVEEYEDYYDDPGPSGSGANAGAGGDLEDDSQGRHKFLHSYSYYFAMLHFHHDFTIENISIIGICLLELLTL